MIMPINKNIQVPVACGSGCVGEEVCGEEEGEWEWERKGRNSTSQEGHI